MTTLLTINSSTEDWQDSQWQIVPFFVTLSQVAPPAFPSDIVWAEPLEFVLPGTVRFSQPPLTRTIDEATHQSLLEQSLREYEDIWRDLADR